MWRLYRWWSLKLQLSCPGNWHTLEAQGSHQSIPINSHGIFKSIKKLYVVILTKEKNKKTKHASWSGKTKVQLLRHILSITALSSQAQPTQNNPAALLSQLSETKILTNSSTSCASLTQLCTPKVLQHRTPQTELGSSHGRLKCRWQRWTWKCIM